MSIIKSFSVGNGDMFYINHDTDNFSIIDCYLSDDNKERIVKDIKHAHLNKGITRFISTHPDEDHLCGLKYLDDNIDIPNFYCVKNQVSKEEETEDFKHYCKLRDSEKAFYIERGCSRKWMNLDDEQRGSAGINVIWPVSNNQHHKDALALAQTGESPNNISAVIQYSLKDSATILWMGDLEKDHMEKIAKAIQWPKVDIVFASHHGRDSGKIPDSILSQLQPKLIVIGEAPCRTLNYYGGYNTLTQNSAGDITFDCKHKKVHVFVSEPDYDVDFLDYDYATGDDYYLGTLNL